MHFHKIKKITLLLLCVCSFFNAYCQLNEQRIFLWDVSGSLLPNKKGVKDLGGHELPVYPKGNNLYVQLQTAIIDAVNNVEDDPMNIITVIPFQEQPLAVWEYRATPEGKAKLTKDIKGFRYKPHKFTSIVNAMRKFQALVKPDRINYMFLFTDGTDDNPSTKEHFIETIKGWQPNNYGFYVLVDPAADIRSSVTPVPDNFWFVKDANQLIKTWSLPSHIAYNVRDENYKEMIINGNTNKAGKDASILIVPEENRYYDIRVENGNVESGKIKFSLVKKNADIPENYTLKAEIRLEGADAYSFMAPKEITIDCINSPERTLKIEFE